MQAEITSVGGNGRQTPAVGLAKVEKALKRSRILNADGESVKLEILKQNLPSLLSQYSAKQKAAQEYKDYVDDIASTAGLLPAVVTKFVKAMSGEKFAEAKREVEQLSMVFEEVGCGT